MSLIQIKNRWTLEVMFECEADSMRVAVELAVGKKVDLAGAYLDGAYLAGANLAGAYLDGAYLAGANLARANLARANLARANLDGANLARANLARANLDGAYLDGAKYGDHPISVTPLQILGLNWPVLILDTAIKIGCQMHAIDEWDAFSDAEIAAMDGNALTFWHEHKDLIMSAARLHAANATKANESEQAA